MGKQNTSFINRVAKKANMQQKKRIGKKQLSYEEQYALSRELDENIENSFRLLRMSSDFAKRSAKCSK